MTSSEQRGTDSCAGLNTVPTIQAAEGRTEWANARRLAALHGQDIRYCPELGRWLRYDGRRWAVDRGPLVEALTNDVIELVWRQVVEYARDPQNSAAGQMFAFARATSSARGQQGMLRMARTEPAILVRAAQLDTDPWALNVENGTIDLRTGTLRPHQREDMNTKISPVAYDPDATCPKWDTFLHEIMAGNDNLIRFLQRATGMSLTGKILDHALLVLHGVGRNGKSTFLNAVQGVIGPDYSMKSPPNLLMVRRGETHPTERADLFGKRCVSAIEVEDGARLAESLVKELTGGDPIRARFMRQDHFEFQPTHHIWLACNHKPTIRGTDEGAWRRIKLVPFTVAIPEDRQDRNLPDKLLAERAGILRWAVQGAMAWHKNGLGEPVEVRQATADYRGEQDVVAQFLNECCIEGPQCRARAGDLYAAYTAWCQRSGEYAHTQRRFGSALTERGLRRTKANGVWYEGVGLLAA